MQAFFVMIGLPDLATSQMVVIIALAWACALALGWMADLTLDENAYGILLNAAVIMVGAVVGALLWRRFGYGPMAALAQTKAIVAGGSGIALLVAASISRRWF